MSLAPSVILTARVLERSSGLQMLPKHVANARKRVIHYLIWTLCFTPMTNCCLRSVLEHVENGFRVGMLR